MYVRFLVKMRGTGMLDRKTAVFIFRLTVSSFQSLSGIMRHTGRPRRRNPEY